MGFLFGVGGREGGRKERRMEGCFKVFGLVLDESWRGGGTMGIHSFFFKLTLFHSVQLSCTGRCRYVYVSEWAGRV